MMSLSSLADAKYRPSFDHRTQFTQAASSTGFVCQQCMQRGSYSNEHDRLWYDHFMTNSNLANNKMQQSQYVNCQHKSTANLQQSHSQFATCLLDKFQ